MIVSAMKISRIKKCVSAVFILEYENSSHLIKQPNNEVRALQGFLCLNERERGKKQNGEMFAYT